MKIISFIYIFSSLTFCAILRCFRLSSETRSLSEIVMRPTLWKHRNSSRWCSQGADIIKAHIITLTLWLHLWDNFPLPSVVIGHSRSYHFIRLSGSQSGKLTSDPFSYGGMGSYVSTKIPPLHINQPRKTPRFFLIIPISSWSIWSMYHCLWNRLSRLTRMWGVTSNSTWRVLSAGWGEKEKGWYSSMSSFVKPEH